MDLVNNYRYKEIKSNEIQRIVSLVPSTTEILYYLGLGDRLVGVTEHCDYPDEAKTKIKVGTFAFPELSAILSLKPDIVLTHDSVHGEFIKKLQNEEVNVHVSKPESVEDIFSMMIDIGNICGIQKTARQLVEYLEEKMHKICHKSIRRRPRVLHIMGSDPVVTPGSKSYQYDALRIAGADLMSFSCDDTYTKVNMDQITKFDPEVILFCGVNKGETPKPKCKNCNLEKPICHRTVDDILTDKWEFISAVQERRAYPITCNTICRPGPRLIDGIEKLYNLFSQGL